MVNILVLFIILFSANADIDFCSRLTECKSCLFFNCHWNGNSNKCAAQQAGESKQTDEVCKKLVSEDISASEADFVIDLDIVTICIIVVILVAIIIILCSCCKSKKTRHAPLRRVQTLEPIPLQEMYIVQPQQMPNNYVPVSDVPRQIQPPQTTYYIPPTDVPKPTYGLDL